VAASQAGASISPASARWRAGGPAERRATAGRGSPPATLSTPRSPPDRGTAAVSPPPTLSTGSGSRTSGSREPSSHAPASAAGAAVHPRGAWRGAAGPVAPARREICASLRPALPDPSTMVSRPCRGLVQKRAAAAAQEISVRPSQRASAAISPAVAAATASGTAATRGSGERRSR